MIKVCIDEFLKISKKELSGKVIAFTTDTVWGVGVLIDECVECGLAKIYKMKKRDLNKPLAVLAPNIDCILEHIKYDEEIKKMMNLWPGALTIIFKKQDHYFDRVTSLDTIGLRIPNNEIALKILNYIGLTATTSVNLSNSEPLNNSKDIEKYFSEYIDYLIIDETNLTQVSSTVVDVSCKPYKILRQGDILINV